MLLVGNLDGKRLSQEPQLGTMGYCWVASGLAKNRSRISAGNERVTSGWQAAKPRTAVESQLGTTGVFRSCVL